MKKDGKSEMWEEPKRFEIPAYPEIPDVGLYLEQVTKYVSRYILPMHSFSITASMISNYVKKGLIAKPVKKLYCRYFCDRRFEAGIVSGRYTDPAGREEKGRAGAVLYPFLWGFVQPV